MSHETWQGLRGFGAAYRCLTKDFASAESPKVIFEVIGLLRALT
jgi:hypothetical protein